MPKARQAGSISRTLLLPSEYQGTIRLRYQLAVDGCNESQVALAKCLLSSPIKSLEERNFNAQLAVHWLLRAGSKGQEEAIALLKDCVDAGIGINTRNSFEIEKCLKYSKIDNISRRVASAIFRAIMSDTEDILSEESFREKIEKILQEDCDEQFMPSIDEDSSPQPEKLSPPKHTIENKRSEDVNIESQSPISFSKVVSSVQTCLEGNVPIVSLKQVTDYGEHKKWLVGKYCCIVWNLITRSTEDFIQSFSTLNVLISILFFCIFISFVSNFSFHGTELYSFIYSCNLFLVTFLCLLTLLSSTCFVICVSFGVESMKRWLHLIQLFEPNIKSNEVEKKYLKKTTCPLLTFFIISAVYMILLPLNSVQNTFTDLGIFALILMFLVDRTISQQRYHVNISLFLNAVTCLYKSNMLQKWSISALSYVNFNIIYAVGKNYQIHLSFISCLALPFVLPYLYIKMAVGNEKKGWHLVLLPHLMSVSWMNLACFHLVEVDNTNLIFSVCTCLVAMLISRYFGFLITFTLYVIIKAILLSEYMNFYLLLCMPIFGIFYFFSLFSVRKFKLSNESKLCSLVICILVFFLSYQAAKPHNLSVDDINLVLSWDKYETHCHHHAWYRTYPAEVQIACLPFKGRKLSIEGTVTSIEVVQIKNSMQTIASFLPSPFSDFFTCAFGKRYVSCDAKNITPSEKMHCSLYETLNISHCHLHNWDEYKYQILLEVSSRTSPEIILLSDHVCSSFIRQLKEGDFLQTVGIMESNIGGLSPKLQLVKVECSTCISKIDCNTSVMIPQPNYSHSMKNVIWFYLSPFIQYSL